MTKLKLPALLPQGLNDASNALIAVAVIYGLYVLQKAYGAGDRLANQATKPIGQAWSDVSAWAGGWRPVQYNNASFYLNSKYVASDGLIDPKWRAIIEGTNAGIKALFATIAPQGKLLARYIYLLDAEVSQATIK